MTPTLIETNAVNAAMSFQPSLNRSQMMMTSTLVRSAIAAAALSAVAVSAHANLKIPFAWTNSNSVQKFPTENLQAFDLLYVEVNNKGNTVDLGDVPADAGLITPNSASYSFPVTEIVIGSKLNIAAGSAVGSGLEFRRPNDEGTAYIGLTLANFTIDYVKKQVTADTTIMGSGSSKRIAIYDFNVATPLALKYKFPLTVTGHEVLDQLKLTADAKAAFTQGLQLPDFALFALDLNYGTLTQDISTNLRKVKVSTKPYVAQ